MAKELGPTAAVLSELRDRVRAEPRATAGTLPPGLVGLGETGTENFKVYGVTMVTEYSARTRSAVNIGSASSCACATSSRSNGSR
jgi:hypothetical protein